MLVIQAQVLLQPTLLMLAAKKVGRNRLLKWIMLVTLLLTVNRYDQ